MNIKVSNLTFSYGTKKILDDISFEIESNQLLSLIGANGQGKTTLIKCILGHFKNYSGKIMINNKNIKDYKPKELAQAIAYIPQGGTQNFSFNVLDVVLMGTNHMLGVFGNPGPKEIQIAKDAINKVGIGHLENKYFDKLSGGEQQLVLIARALAQSSKVILMDEPTSALDYGNQNYVMKIIRKLTDEGYLIIFSTHTPELALNYADKILALKDSSVYRFGDNKDVFDAKLIKELYNVDVYIDSTKKYFYLK